MPSGEQNKESKLFREEARLKSVFCSLGTGPSKGKRSGLNSSGDSHTSGFLWMLYTETMMSWPRGTWYPPAHSAHSIHSKAAVLCAAPLPWFHAEA